MPRRQRNGISTTPLAGDPGKDLFAYLFLLIMVFAFMLLMSGQGDGNARPGPDQAKAGTSQPLLAPMAQVAELVEEQGRISLRYGDQSYDPKADFQRLVDDQRIQTHSEGKKIIYVRHRAGSEIRLSQYLKTFEFLSANQVGVAFAREDP